ncbi:DUF4214 domain-containing protein [Paraburkholderia sp. CNPSo 3157]|uniref:DUF4214 domain-containing protein n=1 Tax=Paraburkholderia franconis TaxID=2654983 RepID=A0A7X1TFQ7_9BURK|nr:DUF4214 domain-containing protein [Paraburkholderia franconis]MPW17637.1 DUF4214 domain-containing protein [Paraburkholderia franconis]
MAAAQYYEQIQQAYIAYYGRPADPAGQDYWATQMDKAGGDINVIINAFGNSTESTKLYGGSSTAAQVNAIYNQLFGHDADLPGLNFYVQAINAGTFTLASVALNIYNGAQNGDLAEIQAKFGYAKAFTTAVSQSVSAQVAYNGDAASANARAAVTLVTDSASEAAQAANLSTTVANIGSGTVGQTVTLTTSVDNVTLSGNNNVVNGTIGTGATLTAQDKIVGAGSGNTLNIVDNGTTSTTTTSTVVGGVTTGTSSSSTVYGDALPTTVSVSGVQTVNLVSGGATGTSDFSGFTGLTTLNVNEAGGAAGITAAGTTAVTLADVAAAATTINVQGGSNGSVTANGVTAGGTINVGTVAQATGTVSVTENMLATQTGAAIADAINVKGGTTVSVTANLNEKAGAGNTVTGGVITVNGTSATTTVTVNQTAAAMAADTKTAVPGVSTANAGTTAAPGLQAVPASTAAAAVLAKPAVAGVVDGQVIISDVNAASGTLANTITSVSLANFGAGSQINDNALTSLSLTGGTGTLTLTNAATTPTNTALALSLNGVGSKSATTGVVTNVTLADTNNEIKTLNVTTGAKDSYLTITDSNLKTINVSGTNVLNLSTVPTSVTTIAVSGAAGFNDGGSLAADTALTSFTTTSSGKITATLDATKQTFVGSTGQDVITISADATKAITGGSAANNEVIFNNAAGTFNATAGHLTNTNVTGFSVMGLGAASGAATWDMSKLSSSFNAVDVTASNTAASVANTIINAAAGTTLNIAGSGVSAGTVSLSYADTNGATDTANVTIGSALGNLTIGALTLQDANAVGINTVNFTTTGTDAGVLGGAVDTIGALNDNGLSVLNVSGTAGLTITSLSESAHQATAFTINSTESGQNGTTIGTLTDNNLGTLTFTGTANADVGNLVVSGGTVTNLTITNSGTGTATVGDGTAFSDAILTKLTLNGNVAFGANSLTVPAATGAQTGFTLSGATDNAHVNIHLSGAAGAGVTDTITLGNGNNFITDDSLNGTVKVTVGTGSNLVDLSAGGGTDATGSYSATVNLGAHSAATGVDQINVGVLGATGAVNAGGVTAANTVINGAGAGDIITLHDALLASVAQVSDAKQTVISGASSFASALAAADNGLAAHSAVAFQYGGNTYVVESVAAGTGTLQAGDTLIQLTGAHTVVGAAGAPLNPHAFTLAS